MDNCNWLRVRPFVDETLQISRVKNLNIPRSSGEIGLNCKKRVIVETRRFESYRWGGRNDQQRTEVHAFPNLDLDEIQAIKIQETPTSEIQRATDRRYKLARAVDPIAPLLFRHYLDTSRLPEYRGNQGSIPRDQYRRILRRKAIFRERDKGREQGGGGRKMWPRRVARVRRGFDPSRGGKDACLSLSRRLE